MDQKFSSNKQMRLLLGPDKQLECGQLQKSKMATPDDLCHVQLQVNDAFVNPRKHVKRLEKTKNKKCVENLSPRHLLCK